MDEKIVINDKLFYRFIEFTSKYLKIDLTHETFKLICLDQYTPNTKSEYRVKRFADAFRYLIYNLKSNFTKQLIETTYFILTGFKMSQKNLIYIVEYYYRKKDTHTHQKASDMHLKIMDMKVKQKIELAFLITNLILMKSAFYPIIVYQNDIAIYIDAIKQRRVNPNAFYMFLVNCEHFIRKTHNHKRIENDILKDKDEVIYILKNKTEYLRKKYKIKELYLYGSYVKETNLPTSDIDMLVVLDDSFINYEKYEHLKALKQYLHDEMGM
ncbi:nucleotidyltransferase domain-containing protein [Acholeplasma equirhinis]|uniref:nucleotidyltransferase family protein n=1 Tax=Acholeplasma equirhinis TaxID=555393 RepID=UPI00197AEEBB|nr:nucleotidyltransferase domain-containing protein [Acholeplasma equirhinis]MBN3490250.1 nucleotidyltransferase domain-containing protein [Acholeplasma equirhinis]